MDQTFLCSVLRQTSLRWRGGCFEIVESGTYTQYLGAMSTGLSARHESSTTNMATGNGLNRAWYGDGDDAQELWGGMARAVVRYTYFGLKPLLVGAFLKIMLARSLGKEG